MKTKITSDVRKYMSEIGRKGAAATKRTVTAAQRRENGKKGGRPKIDPAVLRFLPAKVDGVVTGWWAIQHGERAFGATKPQAEDRLRDRLKGK